MVELTYEVSLKVFNRRNPLRRAGEDGAELRTSLIWVGGVFQGTSEGW